MLPRWLVVAATKVAFSLLRAVTKGAFPCRRERGIHFIATHKGPAAARKPRLEEDNSIKNLKKKKVQWWQSRAVVNELMFVSKEVLPRSEL